jgi:septin family protein
MEKHVVSVTQFQGDSTRHNYYTTEWRGRAVCLEYSKLNGCGTIIFGMNEQERAEASARRKAEKERLEDERLERIRKNPERLAKWQKHTQDNLDRAMEHLATYKQDLLAAEADGDIAEVALCREDIADAEKCVEEMLVEWKKYHVC